jgi:methylated-DNA-protein-cysteine methyltransferase-like protein
VSDATADFRRRVVEALRSVGAGQVVSYGDLAAEAGYPGAARAVGAVLAGCRPEERLPWWRVVYGDGRLAPGKEVEQSRRLAAEGVVVRAGRIASTRRGGEGSGGAARRTRRAGRSRR